jgi:hypothetical protein
MIVCYDLDGTITADPKFYRAEMDGHRSAGHEVHVLSAHEEGPATNAHLLAKSSLLHDLGLGNSYDKLAVVDGPHKAIPRNKVAYMRSVGATHLVDNRKGNVRAAAKAGFTGHHSMQPKGRSHP